MESFYNLFRHRRVLFATVRDGLRSRNSGNVLGVAWLLFYPLLFLAMYALVFVQILQVRIPGLGTLDYILVVFSGLVPFLAFSEGFGVGTSSIVSNRELLMNTLFPIELVVVRDVLIGHANMGMGMLILWGAVLYVQGFQWAHLLVPLIYGLQILMVIGLVSITASLTVFFRDLQQAVPILILFMMMVSPIAYTEDMVPEGMKSLLLLNPLAWLMGLYRDCLIAGVVDLSALAVVSFFSLAIFILGSLFVRRLKPIFADYV